MVTQTDRDAQKSPGKGCGGGRRTTLKTILTQDRKGTPMFRVKQFHEKFPNDDACLEWLKNYLYPNGIVCKNCQRVTKHHRVASRPSYCCDFCGNHVHPTAGTIYHKSTTPLRSWFYAVFLMANTRMGISAKQLERELGVTYKTAWRILTQIRKGISIPIQ